MYFSYFDESGDSGYNSQTNSFVLAGILVRDEDWLDALNQIISFRRFLHDRFYISPRAELKAYWILHRKGDFKNTRLSFSARIEVLKAVTRFQRNSGLFHSFAVLIDKQKVRVHTTSPREHAWQRVIERLDRFVENLGSYVHILPDEGHGEFIKKKLRKMRRFHRVGSAYNPGQLLNATTERLIEDSSDRSSGNSYFIQLVDINAYSAFRKVFPSNNIGEDLWDNLGDSRIEEVNAIRGGPTGIVVWPQ